MLTVNYYIGESAIHGLGIFAAEDIRKNQEVWRFDPNFDIELPEDFVALFTPNDREFVETHAEYIEERKVFILGNDGDIYMNHSSTPSLIDRGNTMTAAHDISIGEELTGDYSVVKVISFREKNEN